MASNGASGSDAERGSWSNPGVAVLHALAASAVTASRPVALFLFAPQGATTHASVFLGVSRQSGLCAAPLALSTQGAPLAVRCAALGVAESHRLAGTAAARTFSSGAARPAVASPAAAHPGSSTEAASPSSLTAPIAEGGVPSSQDLVVAGLRTTVRLHLEEPSVGSRHMHPCLRPECGCMGVFYTCFGGGSAELCVTVGLEEAAGPAAGVSASTLLPSTSSSSPLASSLPPACPPRSAGAGTGGAALCSASETLPRRAARQAFALAPPSLGLFHNACGQDGVVSSHKPIKPLRSAFDAEAGVWRVWIRPKATTGSHLAQVRVQWGANVVMSGGFEVRTKPHKWVLLQRVPSHWDVAAVEAFVARCDPHSTAPIITLVRPSAPPAGAPADAGMPHAFVQLRDRSAAHDMMKGFRSLCASPASSSSSSCAASPGAASGKVCDGVVASFLAGLSRAVAEDPSLASLPVPVPSLACPAFVQVPADDTASTASVRSVSGGALSPPERASKRGRDSDVSDEYELPEQSPEEKHASCTASSGSPRSASPGPASKRARPVSPLGLSLASQREWECASVGSSTSFSSGLASTNGTGRCTSATEDAMSFQSLPAPVLPLRAPRWRVGGAHLAAPSLIQRSVSLASCGVDCEEGVLERPPTDECLSVECDDSIDQFGAGFDDSSLLGLLA